MMLVRLQLQNALSHSWNLLAVVFKFKFLFAFSLFILCLFYYLYQKICLLIIVCIQTLLESYLGFYITFQSLATPPFLAFESVVELPTLRMLSNTADRNSQEPTLLPSLSSVHACKPFISHVWSRLWRELTKSIVVIPLPVFMRKLCFISLVIWNCIALTSSLWFFSEIWNFIYEIKELQNATFAIRMLCQSPSNNIDSHKVACKVLYLLYILLICASFFTNLNVN